LLKQLNNTTYRYYPTNVGIFLLKPPKYMVLICQYEAVGLIIAAKSILRFNATQKSEYVLVGTLLSFGIAVFAGIVINLINGI